MGDIVDLLGLARRPADVSLLHSEEIVPANWVGIAVWRRVVASWRSRWTVLGGSRPFINVVNNGVSQDGICVDWRRVQDGSRSFGLVCFALLCFALLWIAGHWPTSIGWGDYLSLPILSSVGILMLGMDCGGGVCLELGAIHGHIFWLGCCLLDWVKVGKQNVWASLCSPIHWGASNYLFYEMFGVSEFSSNSDGGKNGLSDSLHCGLEHSTTFGKLEVMGGYSFIGQGCWSNYASMVWVIDGWKVEGTISVLAVRLWLCYNKS